MTEEEWLECTDPWKMLPFLEGKVSNRKIRLFAAVCCRRIWHLLLPESRHALEIGENYADALATEQERQTAFEQAQILTFRLMEIGQEDGYWNKLLEINPNDKDARRHYRRLIAGMGTGISTAFNAASAVVGVVEGANRFTGSYKSMSYNHAAIASAHTDPHSRNLYSLEEAEFTAQIALLRDIFGNPFRPYPKPASWSSTVVQLAESHYQGNDCRLPLSDALEEAGHVELADHFRKDEWHPKGCWVVDLVLGKE